MAINSGKLSELYPEVGAGGFSRVDGTIDFYVRLNALLAPSMTVLDIGAGRGVHLERSDSPFRRQLQTIQGKVERLIGVDVDHAIFDNKFLDERQLIAANKPLPFDDARFDLVYADWVLEHLETPSRFSAEIHRVLKPDGWFCARTPNLWGVTSLASRILPHRLHTKALKLLQPGRKEHDIFPTFYRLNTKAALAEHFSRAEWDDFSYRHNPDPPYVQRSIFLMRAMALYLKLSPNLLATNMHVFLKKK